MDTKTANDQPPFVHIPDTVSAEARAYLRALKAPAEPPPFPGPDDLHGWQLLRAAAEKEALARCAATVQRYRPVVVARRLGSVPVLEVRPQEWEDNGEVVVYVHGGAHTLYSAASTLDRAAVFAADTGHRVISVDYTPAPVARYDRMSDEVVTVVQALLREARQLADVLLYGDDSGGGLAAAAILKMRDRGLGLPAAAVLASPWVDLTGAGDTEVTLAGADPVWLAPSQAARAAAAFAPPAEQRHPYASPVYGDFGPGFPPTLIQGGTKEALLSGFVRLHAALDDAGIDVRLELSEGMPHGFVTRIPEAPEARAARRRITRFVRRHLGGAARLAASREAPDGAFVGRRAPRLQWLHQT